MKIRKRRKDGVMQTYHVKPAHQKKYMKKINRSIAKSLDKQRKPLSRNAVIRQKLNDPRIRFDEFYNFLQEKDIGNWDDVNSEEIIQQYIAEKTREGIHVSHILKAIEKNPSTQELYAIWLGNSMETPTPINNKKDLVEALGIDLKGKTRGY